MKSVQSHLWDLGYTTIHELETENGILASGREEIYGCIFGRDSLITSLTLLKTYERTGDSYFLTLVKKILFNLASLQGKEVNIQSGEERGKCIHEFRPANHEHLTKALASPWFVYPDNMMRNYDTVDATPLFLIAIHEYYRLTRDHEFMRIMVPHVKSALNWILKYGDTNADGFIDYRFHPDRTSGGLHAQSWMDSSESLFHDNGEPVAYPIAPVEVQAYAYAALRRWSHYFMIHNPLLAIRATKKANILKERFNKKFVLQGPLTWNMAFAIDGTGKPLTGTRSSMGHVLWAASKKIDGSMDTILDAAYIPQLVERLMAPDLFEPQAGVRTLSSQSKQFDPGSYHNGSIWPHDTAMIIEGFMNFGYRLEAGRVRKALMSAYEYFKTPLELFVYRDGEYREYQSASGQGACRKQAWSAAALLAESV
jgi:glycogen debranching enzyme